MGVEARNLELDLCHAQQAVKSRRFHVHLDQIRVHH